MTEDLVDGHPDAKPREAGADAKANEADASVIDETVAGAQSGSARTAPSPNGSRQ